MPSRGSAEPSTSPFVLQHLLRTPKGRTIAFGSLKDSILAGTPAGSLKLQTRRLQATSRRLAAVPAASFASPPLGSAQLAFGQPRGVSVAPSWYNCRR